MTYVPHPNLLVEAERIGFVFGRGGFPKMAPHDLSPAECEAWIKGWEFSKVKMLNGVSVEKIHELVDAAFTTTGASDVLYALDNFVEVALDHKLG
jgi:hypothetical protein